MTVPTRIIFDDGGSVPTLAAFRAGAGGAIPAFRDLLVTKNGNWTEPFTEASNVAVFYNGKVYLHVDDNNADHVEFYMADAMSALNTVTGNQAPAGATRVHLRRYDTTPTDCSGYWAYCTAENIVFIVKYGTANDDTSGLIFGKPVGSPVPTATKDYMIKAAASNTGTASSQAGVRPDSNGFYSLQNWAASAEAEGLEVPAFANGATSTYGGSNTYANPITGTSTYSYEKVIVRQNSGDIPLGFMPGVAHFHHDEPFADQSLQTIDGDSFRCWLCYNSGMIAINESNGNWWV